MNDADFELTSDNEQKTQSSELIKHKSNLPVIECKHYRRHCVFVSPCCGKLYPCRICHDQEEKNHQLNRHIVNKIVCVECNANQLVSNKCGSCGITFGKYFCSVCRMFDDNEKDQFHCSGCGICRVGGRENFFHCDKCGFCLPLSQRQHRCVEQSSKSDCPICLEDLHTSRDTLHVPKCTHLLHSKCYVNYIQMGHYRCPVCNVSLHNMENAWKALDSEIDATPMPEEYANMKNWILCQDCHKVSHANFHVLGMKCAGCGSYNTCGTDAPVPQETEV